MSIAEARLPLVVTSSVLCLALGVGAGMLGMMAYGYHWDRQPTESGGAPISPPGGGGGMMGGGGPPGGGMPGGGGGGGRGPSSKAQLAALVAKLDVLTRKPLAVQLNDEQKAKVRQQLAGLLDEEDLKEEDAKKRLDALLDVVKDQRETLEAAGYRWPGQGGGGGPGGGQRPPGDAANPFKQEQNSKHLKELQEQLSKGGAA